MLIGRSRRAVNLFPCPGCARSQVFHVIWYTRAHFGVFKRRARNCMAGRRFGHRFIASLVLTRPRFLLTAPGARAVGRITHPDRVGGAASASAPAVRALDHHARFLLRGRRKMGTRGPSRPPHAAPSPQWVIQIKRKTSCFYTVRAAAATTLLSRP